MSDVAIAVDASTQTNGNGTASKLNVAGKKQVMSVEREAVILKKIEDHCGKWGMIANAYVLCIIVFGVSAVSTSVLVSIYTGQEKMISVAAIKVLACISTISLAILTAFNLVSNSGNARNAWRSLNAALMMYRAGAISIEQLIEQYQKGEDMMGNFTFNYGTSTNRDGTFIHDINASNLAKKQKEVNDANENVDTATEKLNAANNELEREEAKVKMIETQLQTSATSDEKEIKQKELDAAKAKLNTAQRRVKDLVAEKENALKTAEEKQKEVLEAKRREN
jgi:hypothetical protein